MPGLVAGNHLTTVMPGFMPGIHVLSQPFKQILPVRILLVN